MRIVFLLFSLLTALFLLLPAIFCIPSHAYPARGSLPEAVTAARQDREADGNSPLSGMSDDDFTVTLQGGETMTLSSYLAGILLAEMPAGFSLDARMAQAVAARTYVLYRLRHRLPLTADSGSCTGYFDEAAARAFYGSLAETAIQRAEEAVCRTDGVILADETGEPILAMFHAMSCEQTADAAEVLGYACPYLVSVPTPEPLSLAGMKSECRFSAEVLQMRLDVDEIFPISAERGADGRVSAVQFGGTVYKGTAVRELLGLRSADFEIITEDDGTVCFSVRGYGHGLGMSQYGAQTMALGGTGWEAILAHYYPGTALTLCRP